jgi:hypothetical protein
VVLVVAAAEQGACLLLPAAEANIEAFVCADCGYFEEYVKDTGNVPWDKLPHFRWCRR